jgi:hypothetical protein
VALSSDVRIRAAASPSHALDRLWASRPTKLRWEEHAAGTTLRGLWAKAKVGGRARSGKDSTLRERIDGARSIPESDYLAGLQAELVLERIRLRMHADNWRILRNFLCEDMPIAASVQRVLPYPSDGATHRLIEALKLAAEAIETAMKER